MKKIRLFLMASVCMAIGSAIASTNQATEYVYEADISQYVLKSVAIPRDGSCITSNNVCTYLKDASGHYYPENPNEQKVFKRK